MCGESLQPPPTDQRARELWLQHAAGYILTRDIRDYAIGQIDPDAPQEARQAAAKAADDALYGLMMLIDGVTGGLRDESGPGDKALRIEVRLQAVLARGSNTVMELDLGDGDGMCVGYHDWIAGEFGDDPIVA